MTDPASFVPTIYGEPPPVGTPTFLRERRTGVGGSDAAAILGVSPWSSALGAWALKRGIMPDTEASERMVWGNRLEHAIRTGFNQDYGTHYLKPPKMFRHERWPFAIGHLDGLEGRRVLEVKKADFKSQEWGEQGTDTIPAHYYAQVQHYLLVVAGEVADVAVLFGGNTMERYEVPANHHFQQALLDDEARFWQQVMTGTQPAPDGSTDAGRALRQLYPRTEVESVEATPELEQIASEYIRATATAAEASTEALRMRQQLEAYMGAAGKLIGAGFTATLSDRKGSIRWREVATDLADQLEADVAELAEPYRGTGSRAFSLKEGA